MRSLVPGSVSSGPVPTFCVSGAREFLAKREPGSGNTDDPRLAGIRDAADRVARSYGLEIFDVQLRREAVGLVLRVTIDRPLQRDLQGRVIVERPEQSIGIEDCQRVSHDLSAILDVEDAVDAAYTLEVSSPGLERGLRDAPDYERFAGRMAKIVVRQAVDRQMHFEGRLLGVEEGAVVMEVGRSKTVRLALDNIARGRLAVEF
jgi:ribosome maturation factor RimP